MLMTDERREDLVARGFDAEEVKAVERWLAYTAGLIAGGVPLKEIRGALDNLVPHADFEWGNLQRTGGWATLYPGQLGDVDLTDPMKEAFLCLTGDVLLAGADGPTVTAIWLRESLARLAELCAS